LFGRDPEQFLNAYLQAFLGNPRDDSEKKYRKIRRRLKRAWNVAAEKNSKEKKETFSVFIVQDKKVSPGSPEFEPPTNLLTFALL
jgi:hypothetical protein